MSPPPNLSIDTITVNDFTQLDSDDLREALEQFDAAIVKTSGELVQLTPGTEQQVAMLDKISRLGTLRKVFRSRLKVLEAAYSKSFNPELDQLPS